MSLLSAAQGVINASAPLPWLIVSGQPTQAQFAVLHREGVRTVIDLRDPMEPRDFDEPEATQALGLHYVVAPVISGALTDAMMDRALAALREANGTPTIMHCNSANRTGGPLLAYLMLEGKVPDVEAVNLAIQAGLRSSELMEWATTYATARK